MQVCGCVTQNETKITIKVASQTLSKAKDPVDCDLPVAQNFWRTCVLFVGPLIPLTLF